MYQSQKSRTAAKQRSRAVARPRPDLSLGLPERLALYVFGVACLISFIMESPVPMAIAP